MSNKKSSPLDKSTLSNEELEEIKRMVINGVVPADIANVMSISVSTVNSYKKALKDEGVNFPSVRGKRPIGLTPNSPSVIRTRKKIQAENLKSTLKREKVSVSKEATKTETKDSTGSSEPSISKFILNGIPVIITGKPTYIRIDDKEFEIKY